MNHKQRYWLFRRGSVYYLEDSATGEQKSLGTSNRQEAERIRAAKSEAEQRPQIGLALAKAYMAAYDPKLIERTWLIVMEQFCQTGKDSTRTRRERALRTKPFVLIRTKKIIETTADDFRQVFATGGIFANHQLRCLQNLAVGLGWLPWPIIPPKLWPKPESKPKRAITSEEHQKVVKMEQNAERRLYYELLWEIGAGQTDAAQLTEENIDWENKLLTYQRKKTGEIACMTIGRRLETLLRQLPTQGPLFPHIIQTLDKDRAAEFRRRCRLLGIEGVSLHSYRYAWAERAKVAGYPERFAQEALGHNSKAVHRAYARKAQVRLPALEEYEQLNATTGSRSEAQIQLCSFRNCLCA
jgi:integrase